MLIFKSRIFSNLSILAPQTTVQFDFRFVEIFWFSVLADSQRNKGRKIAAPISIAKTAHSFNHNEELLINSAADIIFMRPSDVEYPLRMSSSTSSMCNPVAYLTRARVDS